MALKRYRFACRVTYPRGCIDSSFRRALAEVFAQESDVTAKEINSYMADFEWHLAVSGWINY
jgi:hypothetical protein